MRIGVNAFALRVARGGTGYSFAGLLSELLRVDRENSYLFFSHPAGIPLLKKMLPGDIRIIPVRTERQILLYRDEIDLYFSPLNDLRPRMLDIPTVTMLADIQEQYFPGNFTESELEARLETVPELCRSVTTLVTVSEFCKGSIIEKFRIAPEKIEVVPLAPQAGILQSEKPECPPAPDLPAEFFFYPANTYPHKRHGLLLWALWRWPASDGKPPVVVFSGREMPDGFQLRRQIASYNLKDRCRVFSDLPPEQIRWLYRHAVAVVMPTMYEGFGMPAVEALACGCPLICSDLPALREIAGDNALFFAPNRLRDLQRSMQRIRSDSELRARLTKCGPEQVAAFTWESAARKMLRIFAEAPERFRCPQSDPDKSVQVAEVYTTRRGRRVGVSRLAITADDLLKLEGRLYPEMIQLNPAALAKWPRGKEIADRNSRDWRWEIILAAWRDGQLAIVRRTVADCDANQPGARCYSGFYRADGQPARVSFLRRFEKQIRDASQLLPLTLQRMGASAWYRITR
jgi:glycosyltransferase involved in cell wall biosynthesis